MLCGGIFDLQKLQSRIEEIDASLENPQVWENLELAQNLNREKTSLTKRTAPVIQLAQSVDDAIELAEIAVAENDAPTLAELAGESDGMLSQLEDLEFKRMFSGKMDDSNAFVDIKPGSGGTEAQDWAEMLYRMYLHWAQRRGFEAVSIDHSPGDVAGIKSATLRVNGDFAFGWLRTENGIHRLVRKSPFDSGARRHTSFASVFVYPEVDQQIDVDIKTDELRIDTYRASGAGGQHVNRTDSAVRITHIPSGIVVQCQNDRSQHRNKAEAMAMLRSRLFEAEKQKLDEEKQKIEDAKPEISWGNQIRSYVLDQSRIKDLRTGIETGNVNAVLEGNIDMFLEESLKAGV